MVTKDIESNTSLNSFESWPNFSPLTGTLRPLKDLGVSLPILIFYLAYSLSLSLSLYIYIYIYILTIVILWAVIAVLSIYKSGKQ